MTVDEFRAAGEKLFGQRWQHQLAEYFDVRHDLVRHWASGRADIPVWMATELAGVRLLLLLPKLIELMVEICPALTDHHSRHMEVPKPDAQEHKYYDCHVLAHWIEHITD